MSNRSPPPVDRLDRGGDRRVDWASTDHAVAIVDAARPCCERLTVTHTRAGLPRAHDPAAPSRV